MGVWGVYSMQLFGNAPHSIFDLFTLWVPMFPGVVNLQVSYHVQAASLHFVAFVACYVVMLLREHHFASLPSWVWIRYLQCERCGSNVMFSTSHIMLSRERQQLQKNC